MFQRKVEVKLTDFSTFLHATACHITGNMQTMLTTAAVIATVSLVPASNTPAIFTIGHRAFTDAESVNSTKNQEQTGHLNAVKLCKLWKVTREL